MSSHADEQDLRGSVELRLELARMLRHARALSKFARNMSAAARAAGITPSYLHRLEGAEVIASASCYARVCAVYGVPAAPLLRKIGKLDPTLETQLIERMETHWELLQAVLAVPAAQVHDAARTIRETCYDGRTDGEPSSLAPAH